MTNTIRIGALEVIALDDVHDSTFPLEDAFPGVGLDEWDVHRADHPDAFADVLTMRNRVGAFLLRGEGQVMLVDTGLGAGVSGAGRVLNGLRTLGVEAESVQTVFLTHAHMDHIGGTLEPETDGFPEPRHARAVYPNARHVVTALELETASDRARPVLDRLERLGLLETFDAFEPDVSARLGFAPGVLVVPLPGHTPGQFGLLVQNRLLIAADALHHPAQVDRPEWHTPFDADVNLAIETRKNLLERAERDGLLLAASHFPARFGTVAQRSGQHDGRRVWKTVALPE